MIFEEWFDNMLDTYPDDYYGVAKDAWNAAIAARDEELRKQEPVAWIHPLYKESGFKLVGITRWSDDCLPLYAAPIPPEQTGDALVEGMYQKMWKDFVSLQRGDAKQICVEAELYRKSLTAPIPPTPSQQEALEALDNMDDYARMSCGIIPTGATEVLRTFILARPDAVKR